MKPLNPIAKLPMSAALCTLVLVLFPGMSRDALAVFASGDSWDFPLDTRGADSGLAVNLSDSPDFPLDTTGLVAGGVLQSDSPDFVLDTTMPDNGLGVLLSDSPDFVLDTRAADIGLGILLSDSSNFVLDTRAVDTGLGFLLADSADFVLDTRGADTGVGGLLLADSLDFVVDTCDGLDIGLRVFDGLTAIKIAVEAQAAGVQVVSALRLTKNGTNYGILLIPTNWPEASRVRLQTSAGTKAWRRLP